MIDITTNAWGGLISITVGLVLLSISSFGLLAALHLRGLVSNILGFAVIAYGLIVLQAQILSELQVLNWGALLATHAIVVVLTAPYTLKFGPRLGQTSRENFFSAQARFKKILAENLDVAILGAAVCTAMVLGAYLILKVPPNTNDSYLYHLSRVAYWLHHQHMHHFYTPDEVKLIHPINAEIGLFWLTALWGTDLPAGFLQWTATLLTMVAVYGLSRRLAYSRPAALFAGLIWSTFTIVVAQSTSTKNDIMVTLWVMIAVYFLLSGLQQAAYKAPLMLAGLAFGLAAGTKTLSVLTPVGLGLMAGWLTLKQPRTFLVKVVYWTAWSVIGFIFLGAYNYILNWLEFGSFFGPADLAAYHTIRRPTLASLAANLIRIGYLFGDPTGLPRPVIDFIQQWRPQVGAFIASALHIDPNMPGTSWADATFTFADTRYFVSRDGLSWYGPLGVILLVPVIVHQLVIAPFTTNHNIWRWFIALTSVCYIILFALLIRWQPYLGRWIMIGVTLGAPLMAGFFDSFRNKILWRRVVAGAAIWILGWSATHNFHRPLFGPGDIHQADYYDLRAIERPYMADAYRYLDENIPPTARLGVAGEWLLVTWDYLLFGPRLKRPVRQLDKDKLETINLDTFVENDIDYLLLSANTLKTVESHIPVWPVTNIRVTWYLAKRSEAEIFSKANRAPEAFEAIYGDDYRAYRDIKTTLDQHAPSPKILTTDPRMPFYEADSRFEFNIPQELNDFAGYTHFVISPRWTAADYERLGLSEGELQSFLAQDNFVEKVFETKGYTVFAVSIP